MTAAERIKILAPAIRDARAACAKRPYDEVGDHVKSLIEQVETFNDKERERDMQFMRVAIDELRECCKQEDCRDDPLNPAALEFAKRVEDCLR